MEGGTGSQAGIWLENRASVQVGGRARHRVDRVGGLGQGRVSEPLAFVGLPLLAALTSATLMGVFRETHR